MRPSTRDVEHVVNDLTEVARRLGPEMQTYFAYSRERFIELADTVGEVLERVGDERPIRMLDVGPGFQTLMFRALWPELQIDTIGFPDEKFPPADGEHRVIFDLNDCSDVTRWPKLPRAYDVVIYCEVVEHLYTSPVHSLRFFASCMVEGGYLLVTTPNGIALHRRLRLLAGINPQELIREDLSNPGHYREYSRAELSALAERAGLVPVLARMGHFATTGSRASRAFGAITPLLPKDMRKDMELVFRKGG